MGDLPKATYLPSCTCAPPPAAPPLPQLSESRVIYLPDSDRQQRLELELLSGVQLAAAQQTARAN